MVAIAVQTVIVALIVVLSQAGDTLKGAYDFLVAMSVLSYTLPFLFLFAVFLTVQVRAPRSGAAPADAWRTPGGRPAALAIGAVGMTATVVAVICTMVPSPDAKNQFWEAAKLVFASAVLIFSGVIAYALAKRRPSSLPGVVRDRPAGPMVGKGDACEVSKASPFPTLPASPSVPPHFGGGRGGKVAFPWGWRCRRGS